METRDSDVSSPSHTVQDLYQSPGENWVRARFSESSLAPRAYYADLLEFVRNVAPPSEGGTDLLDAGCGCGWSSYYFSKLGYRTTGIDLAPQAFEPPAAENLTMCGGSILKLPFHDESFDVVTTYQCLEHVPDTEAALLEMTRVLKPSGVIAIVGPNLVSPYLSLRFLASAIFRGKLQLRRDAATPHHPYGNTAAELIASFFSISGLLMRKLLRSEPNFRMRTPDQIPPFDGDNDACYLCNPTDLIKYFESRGFRILHRGKPGRLPLSYLFAGGTWLAVQRGR